MTFCLNAKIIKPEDKNINNAVILLHGYGGDGNDIAPVTINWKRFLPNTIFICPDGPETCSINPTGYQWFDLNSEDEEYITKKASEAEKILKEFIVEIKNEFNLLNSNICLSGFSQGCMMSINVGLSDKEKFAGIIGFSGKIINRNELGNRILSRPSTLLIHGDQDEIVPPVNLLEAKDFFERNKIDITTKMLKGCGHNIPVEASSLGLTFLKKIFNINS
jgi:phospholipase/carboxylesterase|tara:strand:+ start:19 stop:678 length:660 start_codon:yes stop_codon:yes gene_type:complete